MRLHTKAFNMLRELETYVNEKGIVRDQIVSVTQSAEELWVLVWYGEQ